MIGFSLSSIVNDEVVVLNPLADVSRKFAMIAIMEQIMQGVFTQGKDEFYVSIIQGFQEPDDSIMPKEYFGTDVVGYDFTVMTIPNEGEETIIWSLQEILGRHVDCYDVARFVVANPVLKYDVETKFVILPFKR
jgi:hypothetical protein